MNSGIKTTDEQIEKYTNLKVNRTNTYMICSINENLDGLVIEKLGDKGASYQEMVDQLPKDDCRYVIMDLEYETNENPPRKTSKLVLFLWAPISTKTKRKFTFAASNDGLKKAFQGIQKEIQVTIFY